MAITGQATLPVARNLQRVRQERGLSLSALARAAGVSKSTLSQLERGTGNPSIDTLWAIAQALNAPLSALFAEIREDAVQVVRFADSTVVATENDGHRGSVVEGHAALRHLLSSRSTAEHELYILDLEPGSCWNAMPHPRNVVEHTIVAHGRVEVGPEGEAEVLDLGDRITFPADRRHHYRVIKGPARLLILLEYP